MLYAIHGTAARRIIAGIQERAAKVRDAAPGVASEFDRVATELERANVEPEPHANGNGALPWSALLWRADLVHDDVLLTVDQLSEATAWTKAAIYKRTSRWHRERGSVVPLPHVRLDGGGIRFRVGELRRWLGDHSEVVVAGRTATAPLGRLVATQARG